jgi:hypothetical protein
MTKTQKVSRMRIVAMAALAFGLAGLCVVAGEPEKSSKAGKNALAKNNPPDTQTKAAEEALAAWQLSDEDLRDEPNLTRGERSLRQTVRRQRAQLANLARDTQQRKQAMEEQQREFEAKLKEAVSASPDVARRRLEQLRAAGQKRIADCDSSLTEQTSLLKTAEEKLQGIPNEDVRDDPNLPSEERQRRRLLRLQRADAENSIRLERDRIERVREQRLMAAIEVGQVDAKLAELGEEVAQPEEVAGGKAAKPSAAAGKTSARKKTPGVAIAPSKLLPPPRMSVLGFLRDRALDLCDLFRFRLHVPDGFRGFGAKARGTCLAQVGAIYVDGKSVGNDRRGAGIWRESRLEGGAGPGYFSRVSDEMIVGNRYTDIRTPWSRLYTRGIVRNGAFWDDGRLHPLSCGAEVQFFILGVEFEAYPLEALDFAIGWFGLDPFNDDESRIQHTWYEWQTIPELNVRDEWQEKPMPPPKKYYLPLEKKAAPPVEEKPLSEEKSAEEKGK